MVHLQRGSVPNEVEGLLFVDETAVRFEHDTGGTTTVPFREVLSARRIRGSPILMLRWERDGERRETAFYFAAPPPLGPLDNRPGAPHGTPPTATSTFRRTTKRKQRRDNTNYLATFAGTFKEEIQGLVAEIRTGIEAAKPSNGD